MTRTPEELVALAGDLTNQLDEAGIDDPEDRICIFSAAIALALRAMPRELRHRRLLAHVDAQLESLEMPDKPQMPASSATVH
jgi:hypothetical protein